MANGQWEESLSTESSGQWRWAFAAESFEIGAGPLALVPLAKINSLTVGKNWAVGIRSLGTRHWALGTDTAPLRHRNWDILALEYLGMGISIGALALALGFGFEPFAWRHCH